MMSYKFERRKKILGLPKKAWWLIALAAIAGLIAGGIAWTNHVYHQNLKAVSNNQKEQVVNIAQDSSVKQIAAQLQQQRLIRSANAFVIYVRGKKVAGKLQAGTFSFAPSEDVETIVDVLTGGRNSTELVTIYPERRVDQIRGTLINFGFKPEDVDQALNNLSQYADLPIMSTVKPANVNTLEGLLWPDSWQKDANTSASDIIRQSLEETQQNLTPDIKSALAAQGLTPYQGLILASIVAKEVITPTDRAQAAQVFLSRFKTNSDLGSDITAYYGSIEATGVPSLSYDSPYNTLIHTGLPPTPISSFEQSALDAVAHPANTSWLYFVTGDNGVTYFAKTFQEHQAQTQKYCHQLCQQ